MQKIPPLRKGDTLLLITPAKSVDSRFVDLAIELFESWGLQVEVGQFALAQENYFAGTDAQRGQDWQWALDHPIAKAILCTRGGYGCIRIVDEVDYSYFKKNPKWVIGFSDVTVLHSQINSNLNLPTIHGVSPIFLDQLPESSESISTLKQVLFGKPIGIKFPSSKINKLGTVEGELVGGNLAIVESLLGTQLDVNMDGKILFIEEVSEYAYKFDRMLWSLKKAGKFENVKAVIIGGLTDMKMSQETFGCDIENLVVEILQEYEIPVAFNFPAGHQLDNRAIVLGGNYQLQVNSKESTLTMMQNG